MDQAQAIENDKQPLWRQVIDFPLVALVLGFATVIVALTIATLLSKYALPDVPGLSPAVEFDIVGIVLLILAYKLVIRNLGELPRDDLPLRNAWKPLGAGLIGGFAIFALVVAVAAGMGVYRIVGEGDTGGLFPALVASALFPAVSEEILFRGVLFRWIEAFGGSWAALLLTSAFFGMAHLFNPNASTIAAVGIAFEAGVMLGAAYMLTRSLWLPMGLHAAWNFTQGEIFDIPVSGTDVNGLVDARLQGPPLLTGNGFGLEASPIAMVIATAFGLWLLWLAIRKGELVQPWWVRRRIVTAS